MPADQGRRLQHNQGLAPVEPAGEPDHNDASSIGCPLGLAIALLIQCQLFPEKEVLRGEGGIWAQAQE
jgi:hypothetical protein